MGHRPNKASWYAVTWRALDKLPGFDIGAAEGFKRGAYQKGTPVIGTPPSPSHGVEENATLRPSHGVGGAPIGPPDGVERTPARPSHGPIEATFGTSPRPSHGHHLENHLLQQQRKVFKAVKNAPLRPTDARTNDLVHVHDDRNDHTDPPPMQPTRRKTIEGAEWIQCEMMA